jgi:hypothetical protein
MPKIILIVEKTGVIKEVSLKTFVEEDLYKKAGFKTAEGFERVHQWTHEKTTVSLYGKTTGRAGQENKYDFPPPVDNMLFFGSCILVAEEGSLKESQWETIYEFLFGGFEDIGDEDSEDDSEDDDDDELIPKTKEGYAKDGFIVDDDEDEEDEEDEEEEVEEEEEDVPPPPKKKSASKTEKSEKKGKKGQKTKNTVFEKIETLVLTPEDETNFLDCTSELEEELYEE